MKTAPVSFKSLIVFTLNDEKPKLPIPDYMKVAFLRNSDLNEYKLTDTFEYRNSEDKKNGGFDGTVHNATMSVAKALDKKYKDAGMFKNTPQKVVMTKARFYSKPDELDDKFFLTAATTDDETKILNALQGSKDFYAAKFRKSV